MPTTLATWAPVFARLEVERPAAPIAAEAEAEGPGTGATELVGAVVGVPLDAEGVGAGLASVGVGVGTGVAAIDHCPAENAIGSVAAGITVTGIPPATARHSRVSVALPLSTPAGTTSEKEEYIGTVTGAAPSVEIVGETTTTEVSADTLRRAASWAPLGQPSDR